MYQLCRRDEYGTASIIKTGDDLDALITEAERIVSDENFNNPLTSELQLVEWDTAVVHFYDADEELPADELGEKVEDLIYAGVSGGGQNLVYFRQGEDLKELKVDDIEYKVRFYLGARDKGNKNLDVKLIDPYYAKNPKGDLLASFADLKYNNMGDKNLLFIKALRK